MVITVIVLLILAGITINLTLGQDGIIKQANQSGPETEKQLATESMNLKITGIQIGKYAEEQKMPTLQDVADKLCEDNDMEYVALKSQKIATLEKIVVGNAISIYTKIKEYPYEFEINSKLQLASIDGIKIATNNTDGLVTQEEYNKLLNRVIELENNIERSKPVQLYSGNTTGNFTLSQSIDDFSIIEIIYRESNSSNGFANSYIKTTPSELKSGISLNSFAYSKAKNNDEFIQLFSCGLTIDGTTAIRSTTTYAYNAGISTQMNTVNNTGNISIIKVNGYY